MQEITLKTKKNTRFLSRRYDTKKMYIPYDAFVLSALISSFLGFCINVYRLKTSSTEKGVIILLLLIAIVYILWNSYAYYYVRADRRKCDTSMARLISGKIQKQWLKPTKTITDVSAFSKDKVANLDLENIKKHIFYYHPEKYEYKENVLTILGNVMESLENLFPGQKFIVAQRGFDSEKRVQKKHYRPTYIQNDLISGFFVDGGLYYESGILFPPEYWSSSNETPVSEYQMFCLVNANHTPFLEFMKNDYKIKKHSASLPEKKTKDSSPESNAVFSLNTMRKKMKLKQDTMTTTIALEDLNDILLENPNLVIETNLETKYKYGHPDTLATIQSLPTLKEGKTWVSHPFVFSSPDLTFTKEFQNFKSYPSFSDVESSLGKNDWILLYSEELYRLDSPFKDKTVFDTMKRHVVKKKGFKNVDGNDDNIQYDKNTLLEKLATFPGTLILVTSPYCPILHCLQEQGRVLKAPIYTFLK